MQTYLFIGGGKDGLSYPAADDAEAVQLPVSVTGRETYIRSTLSVGAASVTFYKYENLTPEQALDLIVKHYNAWDVNRPGGRL
jgi:hypothetical protein